MSNAHPTYAATTSDLPKPHGLSTEVPKPLGNLAVTILVLVAIVLWVWSLIATWSGHPGNGLPFFQMTVSAVVVCGVAMYARSTFSWIVALIAAAAWIAVSMVPFIGLIQVIAQAVTVTALIVGVNVALWAIASNKRPTSMFD